MQNYQKAFIKTVTASDIDSSVSNQHELHGVSKLEDIFGKIEIGDDSKLRLSATIKNGNSGSPQTIDITWYNSRANDPKRKEYRLYYVSSAAPILRQLNVGDDILIGQKASGEIEIIIFPSQNSGHTQWIATDEL